jgi:hypothetical protein
MITIATLLWDATPESFSFSRCYTDEWVEKLYAGFRRNLTLPFRFVCFTDRARIFSPGIETQWLEGEPSYASCIEPYKLGEPMILVGLDTIVVGNCDHLAAYAIGGKKLAVPRDPFFPEKVCNGVALVPHGCRRIYDDFKGGNDMEWIRRQDVAVIDDIFPGQVCSWKGAIKRDGLTDDTRIVYFHGLGKPHELMHVGWIARHWRTDEAAEKAA